MLLRIAVVLLCAWPLFADTPLRVLFIGNSLTYSNDLPAEVKKLAAADGKRVVTEMIAKPNYSLEDHLRDGIARVLQRKWDLVVLQQGPSSMDDSRVALVRDVKAIAALTHARIAVLMSWPPRERWGALPRVAESHRLAAEAVGGMLIAGGAALDAELKRNPRAVLFEGDGFHPSRAGTRVVARAVWEVLRNAGVSPAGPAPSRRRSRGGRRDAARPAGEDAGVTAPRSQRP